MEESVDNIMFRDEQDRQYLLILITFCKDENFGIKAKTCLGLDFEQKQRHLFQPEIFALKSKGGSTFCLLTRTLDMAAGWTDRLSDCDGGGGGCVDCTIVESLSV